MQGLSRFRWAIALSMAIVAGLTSCHQPEAPEYYGFQNVQVAKAGPGQTMLSATVKLYNPNPYNLTLKRAEVDMLINGKHAGHSLLDSTLFIPKKDTFFVPVAVQVDMKAILSNALSFLQSSKVNVALDGRVKIKKGMVTFNRPFHYESKEDLNALLQGAGF